MITRKTIISEGCDNLPIPPVSIRGNCGYGNTGNQLSTVAANTILGPREIMSYIFESAYDLNEISEFRPEYFDIMESLFKLQQICVNYKDNPRNKNQSSEVICDEFLQGKIFIYGNYHEFRIDNIIRCPMFGEQRLQMTIQNKLAVIRKDTPIYSNIDEFDLLDTWFTNVKKNTSSNLYELNLVLQELILSYI